MNNRGPGWVKQAKSSAQFLDHFSATAEGNWGAEAAEEYAQKKYATTAGEFSGTKLSQANIQTVLTNDSGASFRRFKDLLDRLNLKQPPNDIASSEEEARDTLIRGRVSFANAPNKTVEVEANLDERRGSRTAASPFFIGRAATRPRPSIQPPTPR